MTLVILFVLTMILPLAAKVYAEDEIMPLNAITVGMKGIGKTVISGTQIEQFNVEILGILKGQSPDGDLILVRVSGPLIEKTGGIAAGMSGSPVYIDGKVIGAIGYAWGLTDHRMGMVTPIETMLKVLDLADRTKDGNEQIKLEYKNLRRDTEDSSGSTADANTGRQVALAKPIDLDGKTVTTVQFCTNYGAAMGEAKHSDTLYAYPVQTPLMVSGMRGRALTRLTQDLKRFQVVPVASGGVASANTKDPLIPGSAVAVQLVRGDIDISAIGTLTYEKDGRVLAFGHPFLQTGAVEYYLSGAEILGAVDSLDMPFKLGAPGEPQGVILQDRNAGIAGKLGKMPTVIPVEVVVADHDLDVERTLNFQVVRDDELATTLIVDSVLSAFDTVLDRKGYGTSAVELEILGDRLPDNLIRYSNMYYSGEDIAAGSLADFYTLLSLIQTNPFEKVNIGSIKVTMDVAKERQVALIEEAKLLNDELHPGDTAQIEVKFHPYRGEPFTQTFEVKIPESVEPGDVTLTIVSGQDSSYSGEEEGSDGSETSSDSKKDSDSSADTYVVTEHLKNLQEIVDQYMKLPRNNEIVIQFEPYFTDDEEDADLVGAGSAQHADKSKSGKTAKAEGASKRNYTAEAGSTDTDDAETADQPVREIFATDYVLEGSLTLDITIAEPDQSADSADNQMKSSDETGKKKNK